MEATVDFIGKKLGNYEIKELIGTGGMAQVFLALDRNLKREVAVKVLSEKTSTQADFIERFRQEAQTLARLNHPNIVTVYDLGEQDGYFYMVQELLAGPTLEERMNELKARNEKMDRDEILAITSQLAGALDAAHAEGVIHRDVKPCNAMYNASGALVLTDFGIAKSMMADSKLTQTGMIFGTPAYLSPEQAKGLQLTPASDIYSLGVVLYEMITGDAPFSDSTPMGVVLQHIQNDPPPLVPVRAGLPRAVEKVGKQALAKEPEQRFENAGELARALEKAWSPGADAAGAGAAAGIKDDGTRMWNAPASADAAGAVAGAVDDGTRMWDGSAGSASAASAGATAEPAAATSTVDRLKQSLVLPSPLTHRFAPRTVMLVLGVLLVMLLLGRTAMVLSSDDEDGAVSSLATFTPAPGEGGSLFGDGSPTPVPTSESANPTASATSQTKATPTEGGNVTATPAPATATPRPAPQAEDPMVALAQLIQNGINSGQLRGKAAEEISKKMEEALEKVGEGDLHEAAEELMKMVEETNKGLEKGEVDPAFVEQARPLLEQIFQEYGLWSVGEEDDEEEDDEEEDDDDEEVGEGVKKKCKKKGKDKGKGKGWRKHCDD